jgi:hypothetical protein
MKTRHLLLSFLTLAALVSACQEEENLGMPELTVTPAELSFGVDAGSQNVTVKATRDWVVENLPEWIALDPQSGKASTKDQTVTVTVMPNSGVNRTADLKVTIGLLKKTLKVSQTGEAGSEEDALLYANNFDKEAAPTSSPFPYCDVSDIWKNQTGKGIASVEYASAKTSVRGNSPSNTHNSENYVGSGVNNILFGENGYLAIKKIALNGATNLIMTFGTERYLYGAEDNTFKHNEFLVSASIDGEHFANLEYTFATGDLSGTWDLAKTEFAVPAGTEYLYVHFTSTIASGHRLDDLKVLRGGNGTVPDYANGKYIDLGGGSTGGDTTDYEKAPASTVAEFIKSDGKTVYKLTGKVSEFKTGTASSGKNWMQFNLTDDTGTILVYGFKDGQYEAWSSKISDGGTIVVTGTYEFYSSKSQHEVMNATVISFTSGSTPPPTPVEGENLDVIIGKKVAGQQIDVQTNEVFVGAATTKGIVVTDGTNHIYVFTSSAPSAKVGDKVTVKGKLEDYYGLPEITGPTVNVVSSGATVPYPAAKDITATIDSYSSSVAEYITIQAEAFQSGTYINYKVEGATRGVELSSAPSALVSSIKAGDKVTLTGYFNTIHSSRNNVQLILVKVEGGSGETPGGGTPGGDTPGGDTPAGDFASNVTFAAGGSSQLGKIKVNGGSTEFDCLKMGTGSKTGAGTVTLPAGTSKVSFYAIGWTSTGTTLVAEIGGNSQEIAVAANSSVSGNSPWNVTVTASDYHTISLGAPLAAETVANVSTVSNGGTRCILFGIKAE